MKPKRPHPTDPDLATSGRKFKALADQKTPTQLGHPTLPNQPAIAGGGFYSPPPPLSTRIRPARESFVAAAKCLKNKSYNPMQEDFGKTLELCDANMVTSI